MATAIGAVSTLEGGTEATIGASTTSTRASTEATAGAKNGADSTTDSTLAGALAWLAPTPAPSPVTVGLEAPTAVTITTDPALLAPPIATGTTIAGRTDRMTGIAGPGIGITGTGRTNALAEIPGGGGRVSGAGLALGIPTGGGGKVLGAGLLAAALAGATGRTVAISRVGIGTALVTVSSETSASGGATGLENALLAEGDHGSGVGWRRRAALRALGADPPAACAAVGRDSVVTFEDCSLLVTDVALLLDHAPRGRSFDTDATLAFRLT